MRNNGLNISRETKGNNIMKLKDGNTLAMQEYQTGLYVCVYGKNGQMIEQFGTTATKEEFLEEIKDLLVKN